MASTNAGKTYLDPTDELDGYLKYIWRTLCDYFVACGELPDLRSLFMGADLGRSREAAETVMANMLFDLMECISRFSPWYTKPCGAFGIRVSRDLETKTVRRVLESEAIQQWDKLIRPLTMLIRQNSGVIQAMLYVENLVGDDPEDECVTARCGCCPPHTIRLNRSILEKMAVYCSVCRLPFS